MRSIINNNTVNTVAVSSVSLISKSDVGLSETPSLVEQPALAPPCWKPIYPPLPPRCHPRKVGLHFKRKQQKQWDVQMNYGDFYRTSPVVKTRYG